MTERKPQGMSFESWLDKQIREATERGDFDNLPGAGKPLPDAGRGYDENWWLKDYLRREGATGDGVLPTSLLLRRDLDRLSESVRAMKSEQQVREHVTELNTRITAWLRMPHGPYVQLVPVDIDEIADRWRDAQQPQTSTEPDSATTAGSHRRSSSWRSLLRRIR